MAEKEKFLDPCHVLGCLALALAVEEVAGGGCWSVTVLHWQSVTGVLAEEHRFCVEG